MTTETKCPKCGQPMTTTESRDYRQGVALREDQCGTCGHAEGRFVEQHPPEGLAEPPPANLAEPPGENL